MGWETQRQVDANPSWLPWVTGRFYGANYTRATSTGAASLLLFYAVPVYVPNRAGVTVTAIGTEVTSGGTTSTMRLGIYAMTPEGYPGALKVDSGSIATTGIGFLSASISATLRQGWYWLASAHAGVAAPTIQRSSGSVGGKLGAAFPSDTVIVTAMQAFTSASACADAVLNGLPGHFPVLGVDPTATNMPRVLVGV